MFWGLLITRLLSTASYLGYNKNDDSDNGNYKEYTYAYASLKNVADYLATTK